MTLSSSKPPTTSLPVKDERFDRALNGPILDFEAQKIRQESAFNRLKPFSCVH